MMTFTHYSYKYIYIMVQLITTYYYLLFLAKFYCSLRFNLKNADEFVSRYFLWPFTQNTLGVPYVCSLIILFLLFLVLWCWLPCSFVYCSNKCLPMLAVFYRRHSRIFFFVIHLSLVRTILRKKQISRVDCYLAKRKQGYHALSAFVICALRNFNICIASQEIYSSH